MSSRRPIDVRKSRYQQLLSFVRLRPSSTPRESAAQESLSDKSRIIGCSAFRRLQAKAQVFSLARAGTVRTRLTHSIEVSNYGELIAAQIAERLSHDQVLSPDLELAFVQTAENACLLHDIGNPPFGHMGEYAIAKWFDEYRDDLLDSWKRFNPVSSALRTYLDSLCRFDGNPQGIRIVTRLQWLSDHYGLNLTCPLLAASLKYLGVTPREHGRFYKKAGVFPSELDAIEQVYKKLGLSWTSGEPGQRHPLAFVMEAADDIAYCLSDIEDAIEMRVITEDAFLDEMKKQNSVVTSALNTASTDVAMAGSQRVDNRTYHAFRLRLSRALVTAAVNSYLANEKRILDGTMTDSLLSADPEVDAALGALKSFARGVYTSREAVDLELGGLQAIRGTLTYFKPMMHLATTDFDRVRDEDFKDRFRDFPLLTLLLALLPRRHQHVYRWQRDRNPELEPAFRTQLIVDYLSGMTDSHTLKVYNIINGTQPSTIE